MFKQTISYRTPEDETPPPPWILNPQGNTQRQAEIPGEQDNPLVENVISLCVHSAVLRPPRGLYVKAKDVNPTSSLFWNNLDTNFIPPQKFISLN